MAEVHSCLVAVTPISPTDSRPRLVINADDFGYFPEVTRGIERCVNAGTVTATSIIVHRDTPRSVFDSARRLDAIDIGVHLNLTCGHPLTPALQNSLGSFSSKFSLLPNLVSRRISLNMINDEWAAQIEVVRDQGIPVRFLNSHEHLHMFPGLFKRFTSLARRFSVEWIRVCSPEWTLSGSPGHWVRTAVFAATGAMASAPADLRSARLVGIAPSGRLNLDYMKSLVRTLRPGSSYELMCHPGLGETEAAGNLNEYHDWSGEQGLLTGPELPALLNDANVHLCTFSNA